MLLWPMEPFLDTLNMRNTTNVQPFVKWGTLETTTTTNVRHASRAVYRVNIIQVTAPNALNIC